MLQGSLVAIVTPMQEDGALDINALRSLIDFHVEEGTDGIVIVGTTGESPTVNFEEHCLLIKTAVEHTAGRIPVIAGTGANATSEAIELTQHAKNLGADACLLVTPYYNKPPQEGLYQHYRAVAESVDIPQILYNVPGRTACDISNDTVLRLSQIPNIVGIKDATGNMERGSDLIARAPKDFSVYSGDDASGMSLMLMGGRGVISVTANVAPRLMHDLCVAAMAGDAITARITNEKLLALHQKLFVEANPIPVKWVLQQMGMIKSGIRLPLVPLSSAYHDTLRFAMKNAGI
ncbi:MAG: 4-hydroxy-tetrahydrodipicolinate synthase [Nitrosomonadales bacterium]|nr:4-hydroxy-tetrahydrodipicolinate synthase [Nitrosomonadales bacterium]